MSRSHITRASFHLVLTGMLAAALPESSNAQMFGNLTASLANQMEYSFSTETNNEILENWLNADFYFDAFTAGLRMELYQPSEFRTMEEDITFRYFEYFHDNIQARVGNYYAMFGRGMILRTYEDRDIRVDNNLEGVKFDVTYGRFSASFLSGRPEGPSGTRTDLLHGADFTLNTIGTFTLGGSYVSNSPNLRRKAEISSGRMQYSLSHASWMWDFYGEYGKRANRKGTGAYLSSSFTTSGFGLSCEYKYYHNFFFRSDDHFVTYNNPPALVREHSYTLLNRHPYLLNADDEAGIQIEATLSPAPNTSLIANYSLTKDHEGETIWGEGRTLFEETYGEIEHHFSEAFYAIGALGISKQGQDTYTTPIFESTYSLDPVNSFRFVFQHQHTDSKTLRAFENQITYLGEFDNQIYSLEYAHSPKYTASFVAEWTNKSDLQKQFQNRAGEKSFWIFGKFDINISPNHDLSVMYGSRQAGFLCAGGVCRLEPEFEGIEVKLFSRL